MFTMKKLNFQSTGMVKTAEKSIYKRKISNKWICHNECSNQNQNSYNLFNYFIIIRRNINQEWKWKSCWFNCEKYLSYVFLISIKVKKKIIKSTLDDSTVQFEIFGKLNQLLIKGSFKNPQKVTFIK